MADQSNEMGMIERVAVALYEAELLEMREALFSQPAVKKWLLYRA